MTEKHTVDDYLTANEYSKKHGISKEIVERAIKELKGVVTDRKKSIIVRIGSHGSAPRINPDSAAMEIFCNKIKQIQKRGK